MGDTEQLHLTIIISSLFKDGGYLNNKIRKRLEEKRITFSFDWMMRKLNLNDIMDLVKVDLLKAGEYFQKINQLYFESHFDTKLNR